MTLKFKSTKIAATLACLFAFSGLGIAQQNRATIRLTSPGHKGHNAAEVTNQTTPSVAPSPDVNTMPLLRLTTKGALDGFDGGAQPAVFTTKQLDDPSFGFAKRAAYAVPQGSSTRQGSSTQLGAAPIQQGAAISSTPLPPVVSGGNQRLRSDNRSNSRALSDEYIFDGDDRGIPVAVDENWNITGMQTEDTFGHFDTIDGSRLVTPSNRVKIYSPRFAAVRRVDGVFNARRNARVGSFDRKLVMQTAQGKDFSTTTLQNTSPTNIESSKRASGITDRTRGLTAGQAVALIGVRNSFSPYENLDLIKWGRHSASQTARLQLGMQSANAWTDNVRLKVHAKGAQPIVVNDLSGPQQIIHIKSDGKGSVLRITKVASKIAAEIGDEVEFTIRFDNLSSKPVGNVTIVDNLTGRLQYVPGSAACTQKAKFIDQVNDGGSLTLRWEVTDPVRPFKGGIIRFKCKVR